MLSYLSESHGTAVRRIFLGTGCAGFLIRGRNPSPQFEHPPVECYKGRELLLLIRGPRLSSILLGCFSRKAECCGTPFSGRWSAGFGTNLPNESPRGQKFHASHNTKFYWFSCTTKTGCQLFWERHGIGCVGITAQVLWRKGARVTLCIDVTSVMHSLPDSSEVYLGYPPITTFLPRTFQPRWVKYNCWNLVVASLVKKKKQWGLLKSFGGRKSCPECGLFGTAARPVLGPRCLWLWGSEWPSASGCTS
jgi:hypothetical protein